MKKCIQIQWVNYRGYNEAQDCKKCLYAFVYEKEFLYIGKAARFGGSGARYAKGYSYLIDALLKQGYELYISQFQDDEWKHIRDIEAQIIVKYLPIANKRRFQPKNELFIEYIDPWLSEVPA